jgi:ankyrin repeat protein
MPDELRSLDQLTIPKPCDADWDSMIGNDQVRFCEHCHLHVTDLSAMTRHEAMRLVARSQGRLCVRYMQLPGGGVFTRAPERLYRIGRRVSRLAAGAFTATLTLSSAMAQTRPSSVEGSTAAAELAITDGHLQNDIDQSSASVKGTIRTAEGAPVSEATVVLVDPETGEERTAFSPNTGEYLFQSLPAGDYLLWVRRPGFETSSNKIHVPANVTIQLEIVLQELRRISIMGAMGMMIRIEESPLLKAISAEDVEQVRKLAFSDPNINLNDESNGMSALAQAIERGNRDIVSVLVSAGANVNKRSSSGQTALMSLSEKASPELVRDLILAGAKLNARDDTGDNALMNAAGNSTASVLSELIQSGIQIDATNSAGETALFAATRNNNAETIELLINAGINVNQKNENGDTALMTIASFGDFEKAKKLLEHGAETGLTNNDGQTLLMLAGINEDSHLAKLLIEKGSNIDAQDRDGETALMLAAERGPEATILLLIQAGAGIDARDNQGRGALLSAAINGKLENVKALLDAGADFTARDKEGQTALALARETGNDEVVKLLKSRGAPE